MKTSCISCPRTKYNAINEESATYMNNANTQIQDFVAEFPNGLPPAEFAIATEIQNDAKKYEADTKTSLNNIKNEFEELQKRQDELAGAYQIDLKVLIKRQLELLVCIFRIQLDLHRQY